MFLLLLVLVALVLVSGAITGPVRSDGSARRWRVRGPGPLAPRRRDRVA